MGWYHSKCGGDISLLRMRCKKCHKQWNPVSFLLDPVGIRYHSEPKMKPTSYAKWADKLPAVPAIASMLPNWPRWARILSISPIFIGILIGVLWGFGIIKF